MMLKMFDSANPFLDTVYAGTIAVVKDIVPMDPRRIQLSVYWVVLFLVYLLECATNNYLNNITMTVKAV